MKIHFSSYALLATALLAVSCSGGGQDSPEPVTHPTPPSQEKLKINISPSMAGERLALSWDADKSCELECINDMRFRVNKSHNIKLLAGDTLTLHTISIGHPIYVSDIVRGEDRIEGYIGAKKGGLRSFKILRHD